MITPEGQKQDAPLGFKLKHQGGQWKLSKGGKPFSGGFVNIVEPVSKKKGKLHFKKK